MIGYLLVGIGCSGDPPDQSHPTPPVEPPDSGTPSPPDSGAPPPTADLSLVLDPTGYAPLSAELVVDATAPVQVEVRVPGDHGPASDVTYTTPEALAHHRIPVLGLYPDRTQDVIVTLRDGAWEDERRLPVTTAPLADAIHEDIEIVTADLDHMTPGFTLVSEFGKGLQGAVPQRPMMFDAFGDVRWTLDFADHPRLGNLFYDVGVERLANGNLFFGDTNTSAIYEVDMLGNVLDAWPLDPYEFHHNVIELPNGNFLATASVPGADTVEDQVLEIDRVTGEIVTTWDLRQSLDPDRWTWSGQGYDWIHVNAVQYDASDDTLVLSGRVQGVVKLTRDNEVVWILAPHVDWATAGDGTDLSTKLLQPLDAAGEPILDPELLQGQVGHPDFTWNWRQHAVQVLGGGDLALFDNGQERHFSYDDPYSRAVRFHVDETAMTVQQLWAYGEERGAETYSPIVSDIDVLPNGHVIWSPGAVSVDEGPNGTVIELDPDDQVVFEAKIWSINPTFGITFHRTERMTLYP